MGNLDKNEQAIQLGIILGSLAYDLKEEWDIDCEEYRNILGGIAYCIHKRREQGCAEIESFIDTYIRSNFQIEEGLQSEKIKLFIGMMKISQTEDMMNDFDMN